MKTLVLVLSAAVAINAMMGDQQKERLGPISKKCMEVSKIEESVLQQAANGTGTDNPKVKIHALCISKAVGLQNEKGELQIEEITKRMEKEIQDKSEVKKIVELCMIDKGNAEDTAVATWLCFNQNLPENVVVF